MLAHDPVVLLDAPLSFNAEGLGLLRARSLRHVVFGDARVLQLRVGEALAAGATRHVSQATGRAVLGLRKQVLFGRSHGWRRLLRVHVSAASSVRGRHGPPLVDTLRVVADGVGNALIGRFLAEVRVELVLGRLARLADRVSLLLPRHDVLIV